MKAFSANQKESTHRSKCHH